MSKLGQKVRKYGSKIKNDQFFDQIGKDDNHTKRQPEDINPKKRYRLQEKEMKWDSNEDTDEIKERDNTNLVSTDIKYRKRKHQKNLSFFDEK